MNQTTTDTTERTKRKTPPDIVDKIGHKSVDKLYKDVIDIINKSENNITFDNIINITILVLNKVQKFNKLNKYQKKEMTVSMLKWLIDEYNAPGDLDKYDPYIKMLISPAIDNLLILKKRNIFKILKKRIVCC